MTARSCRRRAPKNCGAAAAAAEVPGPDPVRVLTSRSSGRPAESMPLRRAAPAAGVPVFARWQEQRAARSRLQSARAKVFASDAALFLVKAKARPRAFWISRRASPPPLLPICLWYVEMKISLASASAIRRCHQRLRSSRRPTSLLSAWDLVSCGSCGGASSSRRGLAKYLPPRRLRVFLSMTPLPARQR